MEPDRFIGDLLLWTCSLIGSKWKRDLLGSHTYCISFNSFCLSVLTQ